MKRLLITTDLHQHRGKWDKLVRTAAVEHPEFILIAGDILPKDVEFNQQSGGQWVAQVGGTTWVQTGQVYDRLHYVTLDVTAEYTVTNVRHSVFG